MTAKTFVLIDQSIRNLGGHHFEYAERILNEAAKKGYATLLLTHQDFKDKGETRHKVMPVFRRTFWENFVTVPPALAAALWLRDGLANRRARVRSWLRETVLRFAYREPGYVMMWAWDAMRAGPEARVLSTKGLAPESSRLFALACRLFWKICFALLAISWLKRGYRLVFAVLRTLMKIAFLPLGIVAAPLVALWQLMQKGPDYFRTPAAIFKDDLSKALKGLDAESLAYIFVPTLHSVGLNAIQRFLLEHQEFQSVPWGLLYRRNILDGLPHEYHKQVEKLRPLKVAFDRCRSALPDARLTFLTDTDELTDQYDRLGVYKFHTVAVPSDFTVQQRRQRMTAPRGPLTLTFLGDARDEKGFDLMFDLQRALHHDYIATGRVKLLLQANFNVPGGEPGSSCARRLLRDSHNEGVELIHGPFGRERYQELIARTDIMLLPYNARSYAARSSGIFAEALAAGIPSVVPYGTWMASALEPRRQSYLAWLFPIDDGTPVGTDLPTKSLVRHIDSVEMPVDMADAGMDVLLPRNASHGVLRVSIEGARDASVEARLAPVSGYDVTGVCRQQTVRNPGPDTRLPFVLGGAPRAWLKVQALAHGASFTNVTVWLDVYESTFSVPLGVAAAGFGGLAEGFIEATCEVVNHYDDYSASAARLASELRSLYDPGLLVDKIMSLSIGQEESGHAAMGLNSELELLGQR